MKDNIVVIKFGGAYITKKSQLRTINKENLDNLIYIVTNLSKIHKKKVILIHGAGSFGHSEAKQYNVHLGDPTPLQSINSEAISSLTEGMLKTRESVTFLLEIVKSELVKHGLNVFTMSPFSSWKTKNNGKTVVTHNIDNIKFLLDNFPTAIPILHGDVCLDEDSKCSILSGDVIIKEICFNLKVQKCIFVTDVYGVYDSSPSNPNSKLINFLQVSNINNNNTTNHNNNNNNNNNIDTNINNINDDVTGGMKAKLESAFEIAKKNIWTLIIGGDYSKQEILETILNDDLIRHLNSNQESKGTLLYC
ncbi:hypothetical protein DICPUDRAFT_152394 [Dictyostelium purpureum]|uniref:Isopentenyl phosphate kinase n=1 Tax=Dictyostelium purpureum TaxID=5786 RepID=F0ZL86_DICPU|nr:uncharacterized protein DICPUDRAFT_152394 [Dictyostelium purpureum]EGC35304.1 hypothetical protein DICPUDRAFT_152394 [Dictyostelium purpureum]|eukprot:XP_003288171.1 hypothetical protein DICPUDRAFT_152394 [Dictyostelium purpureum]